MDWAGSLREAVNRKWLSKSRWSMPGAGAGQEIAAAEWTQKNAPLLPKALAKTVHPLSWPNWEEPSPIAV